MSNEFLVEKLIVSEVDSDGTNYSSVYLRLKGDSQGHILKIGKSGYLIVIEGVRRDGTPLKLNEHRKLIEKESE